MINLEKLPIGKRPFHFHHEFILKRQHFQKIKFVAFLTLSLLLTATVYSTRGRKKYLNWIDLVK